MTTLRSEFGVAVKPRSDLFRFLGGTPGHGEAEGDLEEGIILWFGLWAEFKGKLDGNPVLRNLS